MRGARGVFATALLLCVAIGSSSAQATTRFVLALGSRAGLAGEDPLLYADDDARRFRDTFVELGSVAPARAALVVDGDVQALEIELARLQGQVEEAVRQGERTEVLFYASGHGDLESLHLDGARYPIAVLKERLGQIPADVTVLVLDACRTARAQRGREKGAVRGPAYDVTVAREVAPRGVVTLYAAREGEVAQESDALEGAFFTHHLVVGLRGAADFDGDKKVTLAEAWRHAHQTTLARSHASASAQHPEMEQALEGEAELVLVELAKARAVLSLPAALAGDLLLFDAASGRVLLEVQKAGGRALDVALPARRVRVQLRPKDALTARVGELDLSLGGTRVLDDSALTEQPLIAMAEKGGAVDPTPWGGVVLVGAGLSPIVGPALVADVAVARRVLETPVFVRARVSGQRSDGERDVGDLRLAYTHLGGAVAVGAEAELWLSTVRFAAGLEGGVEGQRQEAQRLDVERLEALGYTAQDVDTWAVGPVGALDGAVYLPLFGGASVVVAGQLGATVLVVNDAPTPLPWGRARVGLSLEW